MKTKDISKEVLNTWNFMNQINTEWGKYMSSSFIYRGNACQKDAIDTIHELQGSSQNFRFVDWSPVGIQTTFCEKPLLSSNHIEYVNERRQ